VPHTIRRLTKQPWPTQQFRYTTNQKLTIQGAEGAGKSKVVAQSASASDKVKNRLEQLDDLEGGGLQQELDLSQMEYIARIDELKVELTQAWEASVISI
jgi:spermidine/putrescine-binding protein